MRTLASTFSTRDEAEAACRRLESIGISRERIVLKDVAPGADGSASRGAFISVKVTTEQVEPASEILKGSSPAGAAAAAGAMAGLVTPAPGPDRGVAEAVREAPAAADLPPRPLPAREPVPASIREDPPAPAPASPARAAADRARRQRVVIFYLLALLGAFMIGAWLGMLD